jgi:hypothetical protein
MSTPLHTVKEKFGSKEALVDTLMGQLDKLDGESEVEFKERLLRVSNRMLLRLWQREQTLRDGHGSREALVDSIVASQDDGGPSRTKLLGYSTGRLLNMGSGIKSA